jgi:flagellar hook-basal body complex protein FliE
MFLIFIYVYMLGITAMLESTMSNLRINLPDQSMKPPQHTQQHSAHTQSTLNSSKKQEEKIPYNNLKVEVEVGEAIESDNTKTKNEEKNTTSLNSENEKNGKNGKIKIDDKEGKGEKENKENKDENSMKSLKENKLKLDDIDNLLGFDAEKDKSDFFAGQLRGFTGSNNYFYNNNDNINSNIMDNNNNHNNNISNSNNNSYDDNNNNYNNNKTMLTNDKRQNISHNIIPSNPPSINPNYTENRKFLPGVYNPPAYGNRNNGIGKHENGPKIVFAGQTPSSVKLFNDTNRNNSYDNNYNNNNNDNSNNNNNNNLNSKNRNSQNVVTFSDNKNENENFVSAPPFEFQNQVQGTILNSFPSSSINIERNKIMNSERESNNLKSDQILQQQYEIKRKIQLQKFNEIQYEIGASTNIRSFPSFSPPNYPPEGTAIRALREKQKEERLKEEKLKENLNNSTMNKKKNLETASNYSSTYVHNKENILPDITSSVNDRLEYLNNMKKMREKMISFSY